MFSPGEEGIDIKPDIKRIFKIVFAVVAVPVFILMVWFDASMVEYLYAAHRGEQMNRAISRLPDRPTRRQLESEVFRGLRKRTLKPTDTAYTFAGGSVQEIRRRYPGAKAVAYEGLFTRYFEVVYDRHDRSIYIVPCYD